LVGIGSGTPVVVAMIVEVVIEVVVAMIVEVVIEVVVAMIVEVAIEVVVAETVVVRTFPSRSRLNLCRAPENKPMKTELVRRRASARMSRVFVKGVRGS
jgi:hypothetical protein